LVLKYYCFSDYHDNIVLSVTMIFGAVIGGMTSLGGGFLAFPVFTLGLNLSSDVARDFVFVSQATGVNFINILRARFSYKILLFNDILAPKTSFRMKNLRA
jgi:hypothetical protein